MGVLSTVVFLSIGASAFRVKPKKRDQAQVVDAQQGQPAIGGIFAYAPPCTAEPPLQNPRASGGCFPGVRTATVKMQWFGQEADTATTILGPLGFRHPKMDFKLLDLKDDRKSTFYKCDDEVPNQPRGLSKIALHDKDGYVRATENLDLGWGSLLHPMGNVGVQSSFDYNRTSAEARGRQYGWDLIGSAVDDGGKNYVGRQVSHLFQKPSSKECMLTFQGSSSFEDWMANFNLQKKPFCGYAPASASGMAEEEITRSLSAGQSLVHKGFIDALMAIVENDDWQSDIRPKLSSCSQVYVTGHSLGAAQAELFGACVNMAPQQGQDGYEHYKLMSWSR